MCSRPHSDLGPPVCILHNDIEKNLTKSIPNPIMELLKEQASPRGGMGVYPWGSWFSNNTVCEARTKHDRRVKGCRWFEEGQRGWPANPIVDYIACTSESRVKGWSHTRHAAVYGPTSQSALWFPPMELKWLEPDKITSSEMTSALFKILTEIRRKPGHHLVLSDQLKW